MKIAVCDDDRDELSLISSFLDSYQKERNVFLDLTTFQSSTELASTVCQNSYDIYLLDVIMPALNGIDLAKEIRSFDKASAILFLTSSSEFAVESYTVKAANYLMKPVCKDKLFRALDEIREQQKQKLEKCIVIKSMTGIHKIQLAQLVYAEAQGRKVIYNLQNKEQIECVGRFTDISNTLLKNAEFIHPHRSYLVNMNYISSIYASGIQLLTGKTIPLARRRFAEIKAHYLASQMKDTVILRETF